MDFNEALILLELEISLSKKPKTPAELADLKSQLDKKNLDPNLVKKKKKVVYDPDKNKVSLQNVKPINPQTANILARIK